MHRLDAAAVQPEPERRDRCIIRTVSRCQGPLRIICPTWRHHAQERAVIRIRSQRSGPGRRTDVHHVVVGFLDSRRCRQVRAVIAGASHDQHPMRGRLIDHVLKALARLYRRAANQDDPRPELARVIDAAGDPVGRAEPIGIKRLDRHDRAARRDPRGAEIVVARRGDQAAQVRPVPELAVVVRVKALVHEVPAGPHA